jgi:hypothetical protein
MEREEVSKVGKGKKVERKLEPLTDKTVYYEDLNTGPRSKKKRVFESSTVTAFILLMLTISVARPTTCGVLNKLLIDPLLKRTYASLGKLHGFVTFVTMCQAIF